MITPILLGSLSIIVCMTIAYAPVYFVKRERRRRITRPPTTDKILRPPGESLRLKVEKLTEDLDENLVMVLLTGAFMAILLTTFNSGMVSRSNSWTGIAVTLVFGVTAVSILAKKLKKIHIDLVNHRLGFDGERYVGHYLDQLMLDGCHVFHDFQTDKLGNIDHIVVASSGVYVVETKTRRKEGNNNNNITFDGQELHFPHTRDAHGIKQAKDNARWLSAWLGGATGHKTFVYPILTFPGWWVESKVKPTDISVLNPKQIGGFIRSRPATLDTDQFKRICFQLDQKCRDVTF